MRCLTASLNALPPLNLTVLAAGILSSAPVYGFRSIQAAHLLDLKVPNYESIEQPMLEIHLNIQGGSDHHWEVGQALQPYLTP